MGFRIARAAAALVVLFAFGDTANGQTAPSRLTLAEGPSLSGAAYSLILTQDAAIADSDSHIVREARLRFRFTDGERIDDLRSRVALVFDSARGAVSSPHGREVVDARRLIGPALRLEYGHAGGAPEWAGQVPSIDFGMFGGTFPVSALIDFAFPQVGRALREGEQWEATAARRSIEGNVWIEESVLVRWTLDRIETGPNGRRAHVTFTMRRPDERALEAAGSFVVDASTGLLLELSYEETVPGTWSFGGEDLPFVQTTRLRIVADAATSAGAIDRP
jgi:hypothetical protein